MASVPYTFNETIDSTINSYYKIRYSGSWTISNASDPTRINVSGSIKIDIIRTGNTYKAKWTNTANMSNKDFQLTILGVVISTASNPVGFQFPVSLCASTETTAVSTNINITPLRTDAYGGAPKIEFVMWESGAPGQCSAPSHEGPAASGGLAIPPLPDPGPVDPCEGVPPPDCEHGAEHTGIAPDCWKCKEPPEPSLPECDPSECWIGPGLWPGTIASALGACPEGLDDYEIQFRSGNLNLHDA